MERHESRIDSAEYYQHRTNKKFEKLEEDVKQHLPDGECKNTLLQILENERPKIFETSLERIQEILNLNKEVSDVLWELDKISRWDFHVMNYEGTDYIVGDTFSADVRYLQKHEKEIKIKDKEGKILNFVVQPGIDDRIKQLKHDLQTLRKKARALAKKLHKASSIK